MAATSVSGATATTSARPGHQLFTLEQCYQMQSEWKAYTPPGSKHSKPAPLRLTHLAQQACDQEGIDPHDLCYREIWQFAEPNVSEEIQLMRHAAYMQLREDKMDCVLRARDAIISARADREELSKAVEAKVRATIGEGSVSGAGDGSHDPMVMKWDGKSYATLDGKRVSEPKVKVPSSLVSFPASDGFAALYSQTHSPVKSKAGAGAASPTRGGSRPERRGSASRRTKNEVLVRARAIEAQKRAYLDKEIRTADARAAERIERRDIVRDVSLRTKAEVREHRIRMASETAKALEERRQRRARRRLIKKFLKSAALQMTTLEDVEKETELKALKEQKRKDFVSRAERKHEFRISRIQARIREKEARVRAQEAAREDALRRQKLRIQREQIAREKILEMDRTNALRNRKPRDAEKELLSALKLESGKARPGSKAGKKGATGSAVGKLFVSPASFPSFGVWMFLQHLGINHEVVNVQVLDEVSREMYARDYSPLLPTMKMSDGKTVSGVSTLLTSLVERLDLPEGIRESLWPSDSVDQETVGEALKLVEPLYFRTLEYVLPLLTPLMRPWEAKAAETELERFEASRRESGSGAGAAGSAEAEESKAGRPDKSGAIASLEQLVTSALRLLMGSGKAFLLSDTVSLGDFALIPAFHILLLSGYPLPEQLLDYLASFASVVPSLIELEEPLCILFMKISNAEGRPSSPKSSGAYKSSGSPRPTATSTAAGSRSPTSTLAR